MTTPDDQRLQAVPPLAPGQHGHVAERYRQAALQLVARVSFCAAMIDHCLRTVPDDNDALAEWARVSGSAGDELTLAVMMFWQTRELVGES